MLFLCSVKTRLKCFLQFLSVGLVVFHHFGSPLKWLYRGRRAAEFALTLWRLCIVHVCVFVCAGLGDREGQGQDSQAHEDLGPQHRHPYVHQHCFILTCRPTYLPLSPPSLLPSMIDIPLFFFFYVLGSHLPMSRKLLGDYAAVSCLPYFLPLPFSKLRPLSFFLCSHPHPPPPPPLAFLSCMIHSLPSGFCYCCC